MARPTQVPGLDRRTSLADAAPKLLVARLGDVVRIARRLSRQVEPAGVHDLRVATRRLRVALALFRCTSLDGLAQRAKQLQDALGAVRDLEVEIEWLASVSSRHSFAEPLLAETRRRVASRESSLARRLLGWQRGLPVPEIRRALGSIGGKLGGRRMRAALRKRLEQANRRLEAVQGSVDARRGHRARIAVKKLRYLAELLEPAFPRASRPLIEALAKPQGDLGDWHDASRWWARWSRRRGASRRAASRLAYLAAERMRRAQLQVSKDVRRWRRSRVASRVGSLLSD